MLLKHGVLLSLVLAGPLTGDSAPLTGTWRSGDSEKGGGIILVIEGADGADFQLELWRGAPSYNMGSLEGHVNIMEGRGVFETQVDPWVCRIDFEFSGDQLVLKQTGKRLDGPPQDTFSPADSDVACGFGHAVFADGIYRRTSWKRPVFRKPPDGTRQ
jgi:hypothetical protein